MNSIDAVQTTLKGLGIKFNVEMKKTNSVILQRLQKLAEFDVID